MPALQLWPSCLRSVSMCPANPRRTEPCCLRRRPASPRSEGSSVAAWEAWQAARRHFFIVTAAGKPVYSRYGDEDALAGTVHHTSGGAWYQWGVVPVRLGQGVLQAAEHASAAQG